MSRYIVIVDDDPDAREILDLILGTLNIPIRQASSGVEALEIVANDPPLLVVLDLAMPKLDGRGTLRELRAKPQIAAIPVIIFTASPKTPELAEELGVPQSMILHKGKVSMTELRRLVITLLKPNIDINLTLLEAPVGG